MAEQVMGLIAISKKNTHLTSTIMKNKYIILLVISAVLTLSFTFSSTQNSNDNLPKSASTKTIDSEPIGGFVAEDRF
jgi:hypothetical protein